MSVSLAARRSPEGFPTVLVLLLWVVIAAIFGIRTAHETLAAPLFGDTDDAMRMVVVHDFLAGQAWFDHLQHRLNTPFGAEIHWSRLIDVPIAALLLVIRPFGGALSDTIVAYVWPLLLLLGLLYFSARASFELAGRAAVFPAVVLPALSLALTAEFEPGRMDHHSVQIILALAMLWLGLRAVHAHRAGLWAGALAATSLAIGTEGLPQVAAMILAFGLLWAFVPGRGRALGLFGAGLLAGAIVHLLVALPPARWLEPACDAFSIVYAAGAAGVGVVFLLLAALPIGNWPPLGRLALGALLGLALLAGVAVAFPLCLGGPYAGVDPWLVLNWINYIAEAKPVWQSFISLPAYVVSVVLPPALALLVIVVRLVRHPEARAQWLIYLIVLLVAVAVMVLQIRGARFTSALAVPAGAYLIVAARNLYLGTRKPTAIAGLLLGWLAFAGLVVGMGVNALVMAIPAGREMVGAGGTGPSKAPCLMPAAFADIRAIPPERMMTSIDLGAHMLLFTPHEVVAAPYHRNEAGVRDAFDFFNRPIGEGRDILARRGIGLIVVCPGMPEMRGFGDAAPDSFIRLWQAGALPDWLVDQSIPDNPFGIYAVLPDSGVSAR